VVPGAGSNGAIAVHGKLEPGAPVVVRGAERLHEGQSVKIIRGGRAGASPVAS
jgi:hypothetical protein